MYKNDHRFKKRLVSINQKDHQVIKTATGAQKYLPIHKNSLWFMKSHRCTKNGQRFMKTASCSQNTKRSPMQKDRPRKKKTAMCVKYGGD